MKQDARSRLGILNFKSLEMAYRIQIRDLAGKTAYVKDCNNELGFEIIQNGQMEWLTSAQAIRITTALDALKISYHVL